MKNSIIMHVNYCEQGQSLDEVCQKAVDWGFDGVEFRSKSSSMETKSYLDTLAKAVERAGLQVVIFGSLGWPNLMANDAAVREKETEAYAQFLRTAAERFQLSVCNTSSGPLLDPDQPYSDYEKHGSGMATEDHWTWAIEGFQVLGDVAELLGFRLAFETHMGYLHDLAVPAKTLVDRIDKPSVGVNLDYGNIIRGANPVSLEESFAVVQDRLYYVHLKNSISLTSGGFMSTGLADGEINNRQFVKLLLAMGYDGPICIEAPRPGDREWYARQDLAYLKSVISDCTGA